MKSHRPLPCALLGALLLAFSSCSRGGGGGGNDAPTTASISGALRLPASPGPALDTEPNDTLGGAQTLGVLSAGQSMTITGATTTTPSNDFDVYAIVAQQRMRITATLTHDGADDFDVAIFDPVSLQAVEFFGTTSVPETGTFIAKGTFFAVVSPFAGDGNYTLQLIAEPSNPVLEIESNDTYAESSYLGELALGASITVSGFASDSTDANDVFTVACPERIDLELILTDGLADFDLEVLDATSDVLNPVSAATFATGQDPEVGLLTVPAMTLVAIDVSAFSSAGSYTLELNALPPSTRRMAAGQLGPGFGEGHAVGDRLVSLERENARALHAGRAYEPIGIAPFPMRAGEVVVTPVDGADASELLARRQCRIKERVPNGPMLLEFDVAPGLSASDRARATLSFVESMKAAAGVRHAEPNYIAHALATEPNDTHYGKQWHYPMIQLPAAWDITQGDASIITAVIDTGGTAHPDLDGRTITGYDFISDPMIAGDGNGIDPDPTDVGDGGGLNPSSFHGTHVAGTVGAESNNGQGVSGVTWAGGIMHLRALGIGGGTTFDIMNAILYAGRKANSSGTLPTNAADVINMSLGGGGFSQTTQDAIDAVHAAGVLVVAAAGNENSSTPSYPAAYANVISVAAVDQGSNRAPYSNFHPTVDIAAPGGDTGEDLDGDGYVDGVLSTLADDSQGSTQFVYAFLQGTSMAAPHIAGVAGLVLAASPSPLTPAQVESILIGNTTDLGPPGHDDEFGHGLVDAYRAVLAASGGGGGSPVLGVAPASASFGASQSSLNVSVSNLGGGLLTLNGTTATTTSGGPWLSATPNSVASPTSTDTSSIALSVDRSGLPDGAYVGNLSVDTNGGVKDVKVTMLVDTTPTLASIDIFVLAADPATGIAENVLRVDPAVGLEFSFAALPPGDYILAAGSDVDDDGFICDEDEPYCGFFPTFDQPVILTVVAGDVLVDLDFSVADPVSISSVVRPREGIRYR